MLQARRRIGRLFYLLLTVSLAVATAFATPGTTTIAGVVYRADGTPAGGTLVISWPAFTSSDGSAVAPGTKSVTLAQGGVLSVEAVTAKDIIDNGKFQEGLSKVIDGTVECLNASIWAKAK
jgi:hypothetical protein